MEEYHPDGHPPSESHLDGYGQSAADRENSFQTIKR